MAPRLVIFDCDGVLVDSEPISVSVLVEVISDAGGHMTEELAYLSFLGRSMASIGEILAADHDFAFTDEHLETVRARLSARLHADLKPIGGVAEAVRRLPCGVCVASSSGLDRIRLSLAATGLLELFEPAIYSASMVSKGKPAPDLFLHAAAAMGAAPADCIVVEDSPAGVRAAKAAGMRVFAFTGGSHAGPAQLRTKLAALAPDLLFDDMARLPELVAAFGSAAKAS